MNSVAGIVTMVEKAVNPYLSPPVQTAKIQRIISLIGLLINIYQERITIPDLWSEQFLPLSH